MHLVCIYEDAQRCWQAAVIHLFLVTNAWGQSEISDLAEDLQQTKYYFKQPHYGKPHPCYKMSWMLKTKIDSKDDQIRKKKLHFVDMKQNEQDIQGSRGTTKHS